MLTLAEKAVAMALFLMTRNKGSGASSSSKAAADEAKPKKGKGETDAARLDDGAKLQARANQHMSTDWGTLFEQQDVPKELARALVRWAGIESSGNPLALSSQGERGLLQLTKTTALTEKAITPAEWDALQAPGTSNEEHARIAYKLANWLWQRAAKLIDNAPEDYISAAWYAKLYHQRPRDVRNGKLHGPALLMSRELAQRWKNDPKAMHRLRAANVVAFGVSEP